METITNKQISTLSCLVFMKSHNEIPADTVVRKMFDRVDDEERVDFEMKQITDFETKRVDYELLPTKTLGNECFREQRLKQSYNNKGF